MRPSRVLKAATLLAVAAPAINVLAALEPAAPQAAAMDLLQVRHLAAAQAVPEPRFQMRRAQPTAAPRLEKRLAGLLGPDPAQQSAEASSSSAAAAASSSSSAALASQSSASAAAQQSSISQVSASLASVASQQQAASLSAASAAASRDAASRSMAASLSAAAEQSSLDAAASASLASVSSAFYATFQKTVTSTSANPTPTGDTGLSQGGKTGIIVGVSVVGGIALIALIIFLYVKFGNKRFSGYEYDDSDIKWPELKADNDGTGAAMQPLPARRTGGAGFDMGEGSDDGHDVTSAGGAHNMEDEKYGNPRNSFTGSTTALSAAPPAGYAVNGTGYGPSGYDGSSHAHSAGYTGGYYDGASSAGGAGAMSYGHSAAGYADPYGQADAYGAAAAAGAYAGHPQAAYAHAGQAPAPAAPAPYVDQHYAQHDAQHAFVDPYGRTTSPPGVQLDAYGNPRM